MNDNIFERISIREYKEKGNAFLKNLIIALTPKVTLVTNDQEKLKIIQKYHDDPVFGGHPGITRTTKKIQQKFYWKYMTRDIRRYVHDCQKCNQNKGMRNTKEEMILTETPAKAFEIMEIDTIGPLPCSQHGNQYAITMICDLTKYLVTVPVIDKSARTVAKAIFDKCILVYGPMKKIITDMGTEYKNNIFDELCKLLKVENVTSTAYHHQTLGTIERSHRTLNEYLRSYISINKSDWDEWLRYFTYCYNTTPSTVHDYCPFELVFGKTPPEFDFLTNNAIDPIYNLESYEKEVKFRLQIAQERSKRLLEKAKIKRKEYYDRNTYSEKIALGDLVLIKQVGHKLDSLFKGPFRVVSLDKRNNCTVKDDNDRTMTVHLDRIRKYKRQ